MKLFVTGGAGFIGSAVIRQAVAAGHSVVNIDKLTYAANLDNLNDVNNSANYVFEQIDILDREAISELLNLHKPDAVLHLAAESHVDRSIDGPGEFMSTNVMGTFSLLESVRGFIQNSNAPSEFRFVHVSTDEVYGDLAESDPAFTESTPYDPSSPYSASKAASDHLVRAWGRTYELPVIISNCSNNYGPYQFPEKLIPVTILNALQRKPIPVYGAGTNIRDWLFVEDHANALLLLAQRGVPGETYNIGGGNERDNLSLVRTICGLMGEILSDQFDYSSLITFVEDRPGHDHRYAIDGRKLSRELGWSPKTGLEAGLAGTVSWYLENEWWWRPLLKAHDVSHRLGQMKANAS